MAELVLAIPGDPEALTGGTLYDRRLLAALESLGRPARMLVLPGRWPDPSVAERAQAEARLADQARGSTLIVDGLALGVLPEEAHRLAARHRLVGLVHHPLALETGHSTERAKALLESEGRALEACRRVVATSPHTARTLRDLFAPAAPIATVPPGIDPAPLAPAEGAPPFELLSLGSLIPRKGFDVLFHALADLRDLPWRLTCIGSEEADPATAAALRSLRSELGLADRIEIAGTRSGASLEAAFRRSHLFVLASHYEGYGIALAEALARGLPLVSTTGGAIPDTVPPEAGLLVPPGDVAALAGALRRVLEDGDLRERLTEGARTARKSLPSWQTTAERFWRAVTRE